MTAEAFESAGIALGALLLLILGVALYRSINRRRTWTDDDIKEARARHKRYEEAAKDDFHSF